jgi:hypothetical protein
MLPSTAPMIRPFDGLSINVPLTMAGPGDGCNVLDAKPERLADVGEFKAREGVVCAPLSLDPRSAGVDSSVNK